METSTKKPNRFLRLIFGALQTVLAVVVIFVAGLFLVSFLKIPGNIEIKIVKSGSMEPAIKTGGIVIIKPSQSYKVGDVITFGKDTKTSVPTTHRIVSITGTDGSTMYSTKGDANEEIDPQEVPQGSVIGRVLVTVPFAGYILDFAKQPIGFVLLIAVPAGFIILNELFAIWSEIQKLHLKKRKNTQPIIEKEQEVKGAPFVDGDWTTRKQM